MEALSSDTGAPPPAASSHDRWGPAAPHRAPPPHAPASHQAGLLFDRGERRSASVWARREPEHPPDTLRTPEAPSGHPRHPPERRPTGRIQGELGRHSVVGQPPLVLSVGLSAIRRPSAQTASFNALCWPSYLGDDPACKKFRAAAVAAREPACRPTPGRLVTDDAWGAPPQCPSSVKRPAGLGEGRLGKNSAPGRSPLSRRSGCPSPAARHRLLWLGIGVDSVGPCPVAGRPWSPMPAPH